MAINLEDHKVYVDSLQMEMVPLSIAKKAVEETYNEAVTKVDSAMALIEKSLSEINKTIDPND